MFKANRLSFFKMLVLPTMAATVFISGCSNEQATAPKSAPAVVEQAVKSTAETPVAGGDLAQGAKVYDKACKLCHDMGVAGAPKLGDKAAWESRMAKGMETLYGSSIKGLNAMPPKGGNAGLSDEEVKNAVAFMASKVQ